MTILLVNQIRRGHRGTAKDSSSISRTFLAQFSLVSEGVPLGVLIMTAAMVPHPEITNILKVRKYILKIKEIQEALFEQI